MPAGLLLPAALVCVCCPLFTPDFYGSHSNNAGDSGLIYSNRCYNCTLMAPNESHLIDTRDYDDTCAVHCCRLDHSSRVSHLPTVQKLFFGSSEVLWCLHPVFPLPIYTASWPLK